MILNIILAILFVGSSGLLWLRVSERIPELIAIPDEVIIARLHEDSAGVRIFFLHFKTFWREGRYKILFWKFCEKFFYRVHIVLMRLDHRMMTLRHRIRTAGSDAAGEQADESMREIETSTDRAYPAKTEKPQEDLSRSKDVSRFAPVRSDRMQEVRRKRIHKTPDSA